MTAARRVLDQLERLGLRVLGAGPGRVVLTRSVHDSVREVASGAHLLVRGQEHRTASIGAGCAVVGPREAFVGGGRTRRDKAVSDWLFQENLSGLLRKYRVDVVLDVGANRGQYARRLRRAGYTGRIVSFEPVPEVFALLAERAAGDDLWDVHQMALGRERAELDMHVLPGSLSVFSSLLPSSAYGADRYEHMADATEVRQVPVRRLDEVLDELLPAGPPPRVLLKLDTQGFDLQAFAGLGERVGDVVALQSEVALLTIYADMPRLPEALQVYEQAGFEVAGMYPVTREGRTGRVLEFDCLLVRADAL